MDSINRQHGIDMRLPQSNLFGFVPEDGAVSIERYRTQVMLLRSSFRTIDGVLHSAIEFVCVKPQSAKGDTCLRVESLVLLTDPELYGGETDPNRWRYLIYQLKSESMRVSLELPASTVLSVARAAQDVCPVTPRIDRGRTDVQYILRAVPPATTTAVVLRVQATSLLGNGESFVRGLGCNGYDALWVLNATAVPNKQADAVVELVLPEPCTLTKIVVSNARTGDVCLSKEQSPPATYDSSVPSEGELAVLSVDIRNDRSTVALNTAAVRLSGVIKTMTDAVTQRMQAGMGLALESGTGGIGRSISNDTALTDPSSVAAIAAILSDGIQTPWNETNVQNDAQFDAQFQQFQLEANRSLTEFDADFATMSELVRLRAEAIRVDQEASALAAQSGSNALARVLHLASFTTGLRILTSQGAALGEMTPEGWATIARIGKVELTAPGTCARNIGLYLFYQKKLADAKNRRDAHLASLRDPDSTVVASNPFSWGNFLSPVPRFFFWIGIFGVIATAILVPIFLVPRCHSPCSKGLCEDIAQSCRKHSHPPPKRTKSAGRSKRYIVEQEEEDSRRNLRTRHSMLSESGGVDEDETRGEGLEGVHYSELPGIEESD
jgi:hypothetical protein